MHDSANHFVTGESSKIAHTNTISYYDANTWDKTVTPIITYTEHEDIITCLANYPKSEGMFISASRDCSVKIWDKRQPKSVATTPKGIHNAMITCIDTQENVLVSAGLDKNVVLWDLRMLPNKTPINIANPSTTQLHKTISVDDSAILKVAIGPQPNTVAVSTLLGLYLVDLQTGNYSIARIKDKQRAIGRYHDLKWSSAKDVLFAAGDDMLVDVYTLES